MIIMLSGTWVDATQVSLVHETWLLLLDQNVGLYEWLLAKILLPNTLHIELLALLLYWLHELVRHSIHHKFVIQKARFYIFIRRLIQIVFLIESLNRAQWLAWITRKNLVANIFGAALFHLVFDATLGIFDLHDPLEGKRELETGFWDNVPGKLRLTVTFLVSNLPNLFKFWTIARCLQKWFAFMLSLVIQNHGIILNVSFNNLIILIRRRLI